MFKSGWDLFCLNYERSCQNIRTLESCCLLDYTILNLNFQFIPSCQYKSNHIVFELNDLMFSFDSSYKLIELGNSPLYKFNTGLLRLRTVILHTSMFVSKPYSIRQIFYYINISVCVSNSNIDASF